MPCAAPCPPGGSARRGRPKTRASAHDPDASGSAAWYCAVGRPCLRRETAAHAHGPQSRGRPPAPTRRRGPARMAAVSGGPVSVRVPRVSANGQSRGKARARVALRASTSKYVLPSKALRRPWRRPCHGVRRRAPTTRTRRRRTPSTTSASSPCPPAAAVHVRARSRRLHKQPPTPPKTCSPTGSPCAATCRRPCSPPRAAAFLRAGEPADGPADVSHVLERRLSADATLSLH